MYEISQDPKISPLWKHAVEEFLKLEKQSGDFIEESWLLEQFGLVQPETCTPEGFNKFRFKYMNDFDNFRKTLLVEHRIALASTGRKKWRILDPKEQGLYAMEQADTDIRKALRKSAALITYVKVDELPQNVVQENNDNMARLAGLQKFVRKTFREKLAGPGR